MLSHPAHCVSFGLGSGLLVPGPGTWGTLAAWLGFIALDTRLDGTGWAIVIALAAVIGAWCAQRTGAALGRPDHGAIVIDEIVAFWIVLIFVPSTLAAQALAFVTFRLFDIVKPPPIRAFDARFKNGAGVMFDDLIAAFYTLVVVAVATRLWN
jgi:phosphatidylglycerophosphatase A